MKNNALYGPWVSANQKVELNTILLEINFSRVHLKQKYQIPKHFFDYP